MRKQTSSREDGMALLDSESVTPSPSTGTFDDNNGDDGQSDGSKIAGVYDKNNGNVADSSGFHERLGARVLFICSFTTMGE